ncbi:calcium binding EGF domain protein [Teladorsagia circumcincta]|uniref:Calcium binding EGF domain protein n=1 Tax=Teladorsagia circumcincta TaxID=45464 RepID=A0A2G9V126_TELCI|nr:calcium binding EGF domain protein [Teladorsagia circumcincta]
MGSTATSDRPETPPNPTAVANNLTKVGPEDSGTPTVPDLSKTTHEAVASSTSTAAPTTELSGASQAATMAGSVGTTDETPSSTTKQPKNVSSRTGEAESSKATTAASSTETPSEGLSTTELPRNVSSGTGNLEGLEVTTTSTGSSSTPKGGISSTTEFPRNVSSGTGEAESSRATTAAGSFETPSEGISSTTGFPKTVSSENGDKGVPKATTTADPSVAPKEGITTTVELPGSLSSGAGDLEGPEITTTSGSSNTSKDGPSSTTELPRSVPSETGDLGGAKSTTVGSSTTRGGLSSTTENPRNVSSGTGDEGRPKATTTAGSSETPREGLRSTTELPRTAPSETGDLGGAKSTTAGSSTTRGGLSSTTENPRNVSSGTEDEGRPKATTIAGSSETPREGLRSTTELPRSAPSETGDLGATTRSPVEPTTKQPTGTEDGEDLDLLATTPTAKSTTSGQLAETTASGSTGASTQPSTAKLPGAEISSTAKSPSPTPGTSRTTQTAATSASSTSQHPTAAATIIPDFPEGHENEIVDGKRPSTSGAAVTTTPVTTVGISSETTPVPGGSTPKGVASEGLPSTPKQHREPVTEDPEESATDTLPTKDTFVLTTVPTPRAPELGPRRGQLERWPYDSPTPSAYVDECATGLHKCDETARCHNYVGGYACFCPMGYRKMDKGVCVGFVGDGYKCMPLEKRGCTEAEWAEANCGRNHMCTVDGSGKKDCDMCKMGFEMKNGECVDINECAKPGLNMCDKNAVCNNLMGTYACQCKKGFRGDGYMCDDEDECRMMPCHPQAECHNKPGSFECKCPDGFEGDGVSKCINPLEHGCKDMQQTCGRTEHTACLSVRLFDGSLGSVCECEPNYRFNNVTHQCEDIDECAENRHNCDPASSTCVNTDGGFTCECYEGYEGTGGVCVDIDECERGVAGCHSMAMCINQPGSCGCKCVHGFTGDGTQCNAMKRESNTTCTPEWQRLCRKENKTCHLDEEDVPQCGSCIEGHHLINGTCQRRHFCTCKVGYIGDGMRCDEEYLASTFSLVIEFGYRSGRATDIATPAVRAHIPAPRVPFATRARRRWVRTAARAKPHFS